MMTYQQQINHPKWQKKRLEVLESCGYECQNCGDKENQLHVHHPFYKRGAMIWEYETEELECLCNKCHKDAHALDERMKRELAYCPDKQRVLGYVTALNAHYRRTEKQYSMKFGSYESIEGVFDILSTFSQEDRLKLVDAFVDCVSKQSENNVTEYLDSVILAKWKLQGVLDQDNL